MSVKSSSDQYQYTGNMMRLYARLQDQQSKDLFFARLKFEMEPNMGTAVGLNEIVKQYQKGDRRRTENTWREDFEQAAAKGKKVILYGAGANGQLYAKLLLNGGVDFYAFCDRARAGSTVCGKPVLAPKELLANPGLYAVIISTKAYYEEVMQWLKENDFPMESVLHCFDFSGGTAYFEFPELFRPGAAFVDAGCYDGRDTIFFSKWCGGSYSKIFAFEPDEKSYTRCMTNIESSGIQNVTLFQKGLSNTSGEALFAASGGGGSYLISTDEVAVNCVRPEANTILVQNMTLDTLSDEKIGMVKMDIEGGEFDALHGAEQIILRDKPLLAICVYHRRGDMLAIMDYLNSLVPEYRFWLRHYGVLSGDTVLYAAI